MAYWEHRHPGQRIGTRSKTAVKCAFHSDTTPSCTLFNDGNGGFNCMGCGAKGNLFQFEARISNCDMQQAELNVAGITGARPLPRREGEVNLGPPTDIYDYRDESGQVLFQKRRYEPEIGGKTFRSFHETEKGWKAGIDPKDGDRTRRVLFNLTDLVKANVVFVVEGEKCARMVMLANLFANAGYSIAVTTSYDGAWKAGQSPKWLDSYNPYFVGKQVFIFPDNDEPGRLYAEHIAQGISPFAFNLRIVDLPDLAEGEDVADFLKAHTPAELEKLVIASKTWVGKALVRASYLVEAVDWAFSANEEIDWLVNGVIQVGANGIIAAEPKAGKSLATLDLLLSMACGVKWLGFEVPRRVRSAYISREDSPLLTKVRMQALLRGKGIPTDLEEHLWVNTREQLGNFDVDDEEQLVNMAHDLKERGIEFAVFDVLNRLHSRNENDNTEMAQVVQKISRIGQLSGASIGIIHHVSKENNSGRFFTRIRGASAIHGWTEWSIGFGVKTIGEKGAKTIRSAEFETKASESADPIEWVINRGDGTLRLDCVDPTSRPDPAGNPVRWYDDK